MFKCSILLLPCVAATVLTMLSGCASGTGASWLGAQKGPQWRLGMQAYTFHKFTFFEAVDKTHALGLKYIEAFPGQTLSKETGAVKFDHAMSKETMASVKAKLASTGITLVNYGVVNLGKDEASARKVFDFAKAMSIETIVAEPDPATFDMLDKLTKEYGIRVAIHNHPKPSKYWDPQAVLDAVKGRSDRIGACADTGHWPRSGINPVDALRKLDGRIVSLHFKDLNELNKRDAHDVIWGTGKCDVRAMLAELKRQKFSGVFSIEYEHNWENSMPEIAECIKAFRTMARELGVQSVE